MKQHKRLQAGVVSIMVTMVMMIVISLIVLGFAEISRNEQRSALDAQLSAQAYYAAESGVNDARVEINNQLNAGQTIQNKTICANQGNYNFTGTVDVTHNAGYTCVLVTGTPSTLVYNVGYKSTVVPLISSAGSAFGKINLSWDLPTGTVNGSALNCYTNPGTQLGKFPVAVGGGQWNCDYPIVRVDMVDTSGSLARNNWHADTATIFFVPFNSNSVGNSIPFANARGSVVGAQCGNTTCSAAITGLGSKQYYMRLTTLYKTDSRLTISSAGNTFADAEANIDSTGQAQDVLRRILVSVDLTGANGFSIPSAAVISQDSVCKQFGSTNGSFNVYTDRSTGGANNPLCKQTNWGSPTP